MYRLVTAYAERDQVVEGVVAEIASRTKVMDVQIGRTATLLAPPSVSRQNLSAKIRIG
jgi:hypothetical protein